MSGIAGIIHFDGRPVEPGQIEAMTAAMHYRGPDGIHHWRRGNVALGQCMLRTTPESLEETQPLTNDDESLVLVMDGRVDNWEELRRELLGKGAVLRTRADAELVLRAYEVWGCDCLKHIDGDFALVIWDARRQEAFCARDRLGNKSFHYHWSGKTFIFASDLKAILGVPWIDRALNQGMLTEFLGAEWHSQDETLWSNILRLMAAHRLTASSCGAIIDRYWSPDLSATLPFHTDGEYIEAYRDLLFDCVKRAARSHRPLAIEVSGGLDSSAILCVAEQLRHESRLPAPGVRGYTLAFKGEVAANEVEYARAAARHAGIDLHEVAPSFMPQQWFTDRALSELDFPGFPNAAMFMRIRELSKKDGCCVTLTGEGGDEWLAGSRLYYAEALTQGDWRTLRDQFGADAGAMGVGLALKGLLKFGFFPLLPKATQHMVKALVRHVRGNSDPASFWLSSQAKRTIELRRQLKHRKPQQGARIGGQQVLLDTLYDAFSDLVMESAERLGAMSGNEMRYPMRDHRFVQFAFSTPERLRLRGNRSKYIHVQAMQGTLPSAILERTTKAEFSIVIRRQLDQLETLLTESLPARHPEWVSPDGMRRLYEIYKTRPDLGWPLWVLWSVFGVECVAASPHR